MTFYQFMIDNQALPYLRQLLTQNHENSIKKEACWTISNITAGNSSQIQVCFPRLSDKFILTSASYISY